MTQTLIGRWNAGCKIIDAVPDGSEDQDTFYVVTAVRYVQGTTRPAEFVTWKTRTDQPGFYWGRYFLVNGGDPDEVRALAVADMNRRAEGAS